jgi:curved DNA-binding protein CbpA
MNDYYAALGVPETATVEEISAAYRQLALRYHPDRQPGNAAATEIFERATEAFEVLSDPELRLRYDRTCLPQSPANRRRPPATWPFVKEGSEASWAEVMQRRRAAAGANPCSHGSARRSQPSGLVRGKGSAMPRWFLGRRIVLCPAAEDWRIKNCTHLAPRDVLHLAERDEYVP